MASDLATQNRDHFNQIASTYEKDLEEGLLSLAKAIKARRDWIGVDWNDHVKVLDYACGTGVISRALAPYATEIIGVDISEEMVAQYNAHAGALSSDAAKMSAIQGNLTDRDHPPAEQFADARYFDFDLIVVGMALHHIDDPTFAITRLGERLKRRGVMFVIDNHSRHHPHNEGPDRLGGDEDFHQCLGADVVKTVRHTGFTQGALKAIFEQAGVGGDFDHVLLEEPIVIRPRGIMVELKLFFARGERV
ncbi:S-adenosyl-L-methionine-dependent methyltransferase [Lipomyces kononenkoae]